MKGEEGKRYALLLAANDSDYVKKVYGGYLNVFVEAFGEQGEKWDLFRVVEGQFPNLDELHNYEGFVISGSPNDAYGNDDWILDLCFLLQSLFAMQKKVLGICFGHQVYPYHTRCISSDIIYIYSSALGGKVGKSSSGWDIGVREVSLTNEFYSSIDELIIPPNLSIIECHQDEVWEVPIGAKVIGYSEKTNVEMFTFGDNILGIQGHPEYTNDILNNLIDRLISNNAIEVPHYLFIRGFGEEAKLQLMEREADRKFWAEICKSFLKGRWTQLPTYF
ncbi:PREDICTED: putative glutamine amidotransferase YLR126C [Erythranthe guttata]|uniref:putative glutamine amidotransferase YLR126C n=1 Tax=Erythranthe guttata TaxID=4155 RepID=UPI00064DD2CA|nr:PREDICTED: putative glutamine amidotransferase YLR126C [Erythranthe guttata]|eukprot:XP_012837813.1 PREDICTED: putative glutamine amidotransferase YLR126C [Erythranthe guttata]